MGEVLAGILDLDDRNGHGIKREVMIEPPSVAWNIQSAENW